jgi:putative phage-type endonuclease
MDRKQWLLERRNCITGTDIAAICGLSKWGSPLSVYLDKKGLVDKSDDDNRYMEWGRRLEQCIADKYSEDTGRSLLKGMFTRKGIFGGTPDFLSLDHHLIEIKTAYQRNAYEWGEQGTDSIPQYYLTQVQWYLGLLDDFDVADVCVLIGGSDYRSYLVKRNDKLIGILRDKAERFWYDHVASDNPPAISMSIDNDLMSEVHGHEKPDFIDRSDLFDLAYQLKDLKEKQDEIEKNIDLVSAKIKNEIGSNYGIRGDGWSATWGKSKDSKRVDWKGIIDEIKPPKEILDKHTVITDGVRRFVFRSNF